ncbi:MAG: sigma-54 dependent transcriptional regulator [Litorivicinaceae bacterium]|jgi:DNA-binding NtrC family response regulator|nr:sigma-54 dependent transcriptional regulator [Litorivicinaceae bacterium]MDF1783269.1 sigma-54 dependent transcriptional regulator [Litorivicinaceae bacterium]NBR74907.1 sigma-54-dependent Fis family transcriptional regulator [Gammaproteobacteria bacterium]
MATLLLVTDEAIIRKSIQMGLEKQGHTILIAESLQAAKQVNTAIDCVICEHRLADGSGIDLIAHFKPIPLILLVGQVSLQAGIVAMRKGAFDCFTKPVDHHDLLKAIERAAALANQASQDGMIGDCDVMLKLKKQISRVAPLDTTILVGGESGTGKELVAQAIHRQSQRADREMLSVNCAAIPESLIEAELFGHVKGAFTGATSDRSGLIESADQSTLFLDEIGELPLEAQSRLLRVLQEGEIRRVGSTERTYVDVRLIAATHRNLLEMVSKGQFREDLYYRLNVIELRCPPLRERGEDVLLLAEFFLNAIQTQMARPELRFSQDAQQAIQQHHWPGNVRELANVIERAVVLCEGPLIDALDLSLQSHGSNPPQFSAGEQRRPSENRPMMSLEDYFQHFVLSHEEHMSETELAKRLGISRKSLWERRNRLGIPRRKDEGSD